MSCIRVLDDFYWLYNRHGSVIFLQATIHRRQECVNVLDITNVFGSLDGKEYPLIGGSVLTSLNFNLARCFLGQFSNALG